MKKPLLLLALFLLPMVASAQSTIIEFADANVKTICVANWDTSGDGELSQAEAAVVTELGQVFTDNQEITSFNELQYFTGLTAIGDDAFKGCWNLASVTLPESLESIGGSSFRWAGLTAIKFPQSLKDIWGHAFRDCASLASIDFNGCSATIYEHAFVGCESLTEVTVPSTCTMVQWNHFGYCNSLKSANILAQAEWVDGILRNCPELETVVLSSTNLLGGSAFGESPKVKTITIQKLEATGRPYELVMGVNPADCRFIIPEGTAEQFLRDGYRNLSDMSALPFVKGVYEAESARVQAMVDGIASGDKTALTAAITTANGIVDVAEDYPTIFAQIDAVNTAAKAFLATATLAENTDVTAAAIIDSNFDSSLYTWNSQDDGWWWWWNGEQSFSNGDIAINRFVEKNIWEEEYGALADGAKFLNIGNLPAGRYRLECDAIATWQHDASVQVTGVSLFAGDQQTPLATENEKPQHFSVDFTLDTASDSKEVGIQVKNTNADWVAFDNVRLTYLGTVVEVTDVTNMANAIYVVPLKGSAGSNVNIEVKLKNANSVTSYGFELVLPAGVTISTSTDGNFDDAVTMSGRHKEHTLTTNKLENNTYKVGVASLSSKSLTDNDGVVLTIQAHVADNIAEGEYAIGVQNPLIVNTDGTKPTVQSTQSKITIVDYTKGDVDGDGVIDLADAVLIINHYVGKPVAKFNEKAADVDGDGVVDLADAVRIINFYVGKVQSLAPSLELDGLDPQ